MASYQPLSEADIYAIKRQYLALLPSQQVIDVCLTFEAHAPLHIKSSVWPYDIRAAIASILAQKAQTSASDSTSSSPQLPEKTAGPSTPAQPTQIPPPAAIGPHYPHQPYYHPPYPHASFPYGYPHPYPSYPQPFPGSPATHQPPLFANAPLVHPPHPISDPSPLTNVDDLPSYEEMIVEALLDSDDPEGCAPKNLFSWMAMHYPLQSNFRPSASQALQKAYKRGRLEKGSNGKYRINENWEGGNTSRRTTRRPQTLSQSALPGPHTPSSPFTHAPLLAHGATTLQARLPPPGQPPGYLAYPLGLPYQGTSAIRDNSGTTAQKQAADAIDRETAEGSDAWEAAQSILKAINFEQLFQISSEDQVAEPLAVNSISQHASIDGPDKPSLVLGAAVSAGPHLDKSTELDAEQRAALQAQLALLAAQLAEIADANENERPEVSQRSTTIPPSSTPQVVGETSGPGGEDGDGDGDSEDMVEIPVPATSLMT